MQSDGIVDFCRACLDHLHDPDNPLPLEWLDESLLLRNTYIAENEQEDHKTGRRYRVGQLNETHTQQLDTFREATLDEGSASLQLTFFFEPDESVESGRAVFAHSSLAYCSASILHHIHLVLRYQQELLSPQQAHDREHWRLCALYGEQDCPTWPEAGTIEQAEQRYNELEASGHYSMEDYWGAGSDAGTTNDAPDSSDDALTAAFLSALKSHAGPSADRMHTIAKIQTALDRALEQFYTGT
ncbi:uncharacterized protein L969DRAFT_52404 [Mixia osmundae IAM 14324]|uniref:Uncharacterized protein n=1 Tax=Mixia osmundae (strain CBS 9802 / IAM 14324 / JCM 22182 / KY 12970) TaxID=764103 RepID=G7E4T1_MIXOS|nr:uncharacterized protein L969DRAFT_52404 [Mixia osmundae IAM 14324]KEI37661.1 hypothetical protein L969DRAFT_52404 [Mixia osmundae IAM 14324]GAA97841.1 hypothetical protein E5Q_04520 [Mixia osmundae IAM 14324]